MTQLVPDSYPDPGHGPTRDPLPDAMPAPIPDPLPDPLPGPMAGPMPEPAQVSAPDPFPYPADGPGDVLDGGGPEDAGRPRRRLLRGVLRWTAVALVFGLFGAATAYAVTLPDRTRIPGLRTPGDGRWTYAPPVLPELPAGRPRPLADANTAGVHYADLRSLLLPQPLDATADRGLPGRTGWLTADAFVRRFQMRDRYSSLVDLRENGLRHVAATGWTMPDGTRTQIYLAQFISAGYASQYMETMEAMWPSGVTDEEVDGSVDSSAVPPAIAVAGYHETKPYGTDDTRFAYLRSGDTIGIVVQSRRGSGLEVPFRQTVRLQAQLLG